MKTYLFPYYISFGKNDSVDMEISVNLSEKDAKRLENSANCGGRFRLDADDEISDIFDKVYTLIIKKEEQELQENPQIVIDALEWEGIKIRSVTKKVIDQYLDELEIGVNYPISLQDLPATRKRIIKPKHAESIIVEKAALETTLENPENRNKIIYSNGGSCLEYIPFDYAGVFEIPEIVMEINGMAFRDRKRITVVDMKCHIDVIPKDLFRRCKSIEEIILPSSLVSIESDAFAECEQLQKLNLPEGLRKIDGTAFRLCSCFSTLCLPQSLEELSPYISSYWNGIKTIIFLGKETQISDHGEFSGITLVAPKESKAEEYAKTHDISFVYLADFFNE